MDPLGINKWAHQLTLGMGPHHRRYHSTMKGLNVATQDGASKRQGRFEKKIMNGLCQVGMGQNLLVSILMGWTSIYQLFWCSPGVQGFDTLPIVYFSGEKRNIQVVRRGGEAFLPRVQTC